MKATSRITIATVSTAARQYTERRAESTQSRRPRRAPDSAAAMPYSATTSASTSAMRPANAISDRPPRSRRAAARRRAVLRGALRDHRTRLGDERARLQGARDDQLPLALERRRNAAAVDHADGPAAAGPIGEPEVELAVRQLALRPLHDGPGQLDALARPRLADQLARAQRGIGRGEARVDQAAREQHRQRERNDEPDLSLARGSHRAG